MKVLPSLTAHPARPSGSCQKDKGRPPGLVGVAGLWPIPSRPGKVVPQPDLRSGEPGVGERAGLRGPPLIEATAGSCHSARGARPLQSAVRPPATQNGSRCPSGSWGLGSGIPRRLVANIGAFRWARLASGVFLRSLTLLGRRWGAPWTQHPSFSLSEVLEQGLSSRHHSQSPF